MLAKELEWLFPLQVLQKADGERTMRTQRRQLFRSAVLMIGIGLPALGWSADDSAGVEPRRISPMETQRSKATIADELNETRTEPPKATPRATRLGRAVTRNSLVRATHFRGAVKATQQEDLATGVTRSGLHKPAPRTSATTESSQVVPVSYYFPEKVPYVIPPDNPGREPRHRRRTHHMGYFRQTAECVPWWFWYISGHGPAMWDRLEY